MSWEFKKKNILVKTSKTNKHKHKQQHIRTHWKTDFAFFQMSKPISEFQSNENLLILRKKIK